MSVDASSPPSRSWFTTHSMRKNDLPAARGTVVPGRRSEGRIGLRSATCRKKSFFVGRLALDERHLGAFLQEFCQSVGVPVGETDTAVGL
jgi:hypothetical protein